MTSCVLYCDYYSIDVTGNYLFYNLISLFILAMGRIWGNPNNFFGGLKNVYSHGIWDTHKYAKERLETCCYCLVIRAPITEGVDTIYAIFFAATVQPQVSFGTLETSSSLRRSVTQDNNDEGILIPNTS